MDRTWEECWRLAWENYYNAKNDDEQKHAEEWIESLAYEAQS